MKNSLRAFAGTLLLALGSNAGASPVFDALFVFGDSLSENGNVALATGAFQDPGLQQATPIPSPGFIPGAPYFRGPTLLPAFSNGPVWSEQFAPALGLPLLPSFLPAALGGPGTNYAVGGARLVPLASPPPGTPPSIREQVDAFLAAIDTTPDPDAPAGGLYVVFGGGNEARDALAAGGDPSAAIGAYASSLASIVQDLVAEGARSLLVVNVPDIGVTPAVREQDMLLGAGGAVIAAASALSDAFNATYDLTLDALDLALAALGVNLYRLDLAALLRDTIANAAALGLDNVTEGCAADPACVADPSGHLFWDGIHVTTRGHALLAEAARQAVAPAPSTLLLAFAGAMLMLLRRLGARCT